MINIEDHGRIRVLRLARAPVNALNPDLCAALVEALAQAAKDDCSGIVLAGGEKVFSAGLDVPFLVALGDDRAALHSAWQRFFAAARALANCPLPVVAALTGHTPAGGCVLSLCCDRRVMAEGDFRIGLNETQVGLAVPEGIQRLMRRVIGPHRAAQLIIPGAMIDAQAALQIGLVDELAAHGDVIARAIAWLRMLEALPRTPMLRSRAIARADLIEALSDEHIALDEMLEAWHSPDTQQALQALMQRLGK